MVIQLRHCNTEKCGIINVGPLQNRTSANRVAYYWSAAAVSWQTSQDHTHTLPVRWYLACDLLHLHTFLQQDIRVVFSEHLTLLERALLKIVLSVCLSVTLVIHDYAVQGIEMHFASYDRLERRFWVVDAKSHSF